MLKPHFTTKWQKKVFLRNLKKKSTLDPEKTHMVHISTAMYRSENKASAYFRISAKFQSPPDRWVDAKNAIISLLYHK